MPISGSVEKSSSQTQSQQRVNRTTATPSSNSMGSAPLESSALGAALNQPQNLTPSAVMYLQRTAGNQAVSQLLNHAPPIQRKLTVGPADDRYEREADQIAQRVMRMPTSATPQLLRPAKSMAPTMQAKRQLQRSPAVGLEGGDISGDLESRIHRSQSGGSPLPKAVRATLEPKLGADFAGVKVHTGPQSVQLNRELGAKAFTHRNHIYYGAGQSPSDLQLTTHEAVHVVQQGGAGTLQRQPETSTATPEAPQATPSISRNLKQAGIQRFAYDDDPSTWAPVTRIKRSGEGAEGVYFVFKGGSMVVVKPLNDPGNVEYANDVVARITGLDVPKTLVYPITGTDPITTLLTSTAIEGAKNDEELTTKLSVSRYWLIMSTVTGTSIQMLGKDNNQVQDAIDFITSREALKDTGRIMVADSFLGNQDRLIGQRVNLGNFFYRADNDRAATIDNDAEVQQAQFRRNGSLDLSTALVVFENLMDGAKRNMHINAFIAKFKQVQPGAVASCNDDNVRAWVGEGIVAALADMKDMFDNDMNTVRSAKAVNKKYGANQKRDYGMIKGSAQYMQARQGGMDQDTAKQKLGKYAKYKSLYNKLPKGLKWSAKIWNGGRGF